MHSLAGWSTQICNKPSKVEVEGKYYCGIHNPNRISDKFAKQSAKFEKKNALRDLNNKLIGIEKDIVAKTLLYSNEMPDYMQKLVEKWFETKNAIKKAEV